MVVASGDPVLWCVVVLRHASKIETIVEKVERKRFVRILTFTFWVAIRDGGACITKSSRKAGLANALATESQQWVAKSIQCPWSIAGTCYDGQRNVRMYV